MFYFFYLLLFTWLVPDKNAWNAFISAKKVIVEQNKMHEKQCHCSDNKIKKRQLQAGILPKKREGYHFILFFNVIRFCISV